jgi:hypothetical protein
MPWLIDQAPQYDPPPMSKKQMEALEKFILASPDAGNYAKRVIIWMLRQTDRLTQPVVLALHEKIFGIEPTERLWRNIHDMCSANGKTHIDLFLAGMGTEMRLSHHGGRMEKRDNKFINTNNPGVTIWISYIFYDPAATVLAVPSIQDIEG